MSGWRCRWFGHRFEPVMYRSGPGKRRFCVRCGREGDAMTTNFVWLRGER